ncbi:tRNA 2'-phosphotransferase 1-like [Octopus bimaculoides]|uniref:2'-phosphotransferase n=1 Tax=Octopus bimaculoides TaxID=37653 RepID=A0A0L8FMF1_OCTBM|nr:tRNA 2'-phosphotransferase 1-like [Octopus bimaculoides]
MSDIQTSKRLVTVLRHTASQMNISIDINGFVKVSELLSTREFSHLTPTDIKRIADNDAKKRYFIKNQYGELMIRANQGHSLQVSDLSFQPVLSGRDYPNVIHGTRHHAWNVISRDGLSKMGRMHIHFAIGVPGDPKVISGMPRNSEIIIYLNLNLALKNGMKFFLSENNVMLTEGDVNGFIKPKYFQKVIDRKTGNLLTW